MIYRSNASGIDGDAVTYAVSVPDATSVSIDSSGEARFDESSDYESNPSYVFTVTASDRELSESADIFLNLDRLIVFGDIDELTELNGGARDFDLLCSSMLVPPKVGLGDYRWAT